MNTVAPPVCGKADPLYPTIFHEPWWLDIAAQGRAAVVEVMDDNGKLVGRLPYLLNSSWGFKRGVMPEFTHFLGPAVDDGLGSADTRFIKRLTITKQLIQKLPPLASFSVKCHRFMTDALAFQIEGFRVSVQFTHEIAPAQHDDIWAGMHHKKRSVITRAQKRVSVSPLNDPAVFRRFYQENLDAKGIKSILNMDVCERLVAAAQEKDRGRVYATFGPEHELQAAVFCVWDATTCYYLMTTRKAGTHTGLVSLLVWEAIKEAATRGLVFDFDGLISEGGLMFSTDFGAKVSPRYIVTRESPLMGFYKTARFFFVDKNCFC